jgi:tetratricopeptide (TPR) repeat protein
VNGDSQSEKPVNKSKKHTSRKKWFIVGVSIAIVIAAGSWFYVSKIEPSLSQTPAQIAAAKEAKRVASVNQTVNKAQTLVTKGSQTQAVAVYDSAIKSASDTKSKAFLLLSQATMYDNNGNYDLALSTAKESESIEKNDNIEQFIAQIYVAKGDNQDAIQYYQRAITYTNKSQTLAEANIQSYQNIIKQLGGASN